MIGFYTVADQGEGGRGGTLFLCQTAAKRAKLFSKLRPCRILGTGLVGPQLLKDLHHCCYQSSLFCKGCIADMYFVFIIYFTLLEASIIKC